MVTVMENDTPQILIVDDEEDICKLFKDFFDFLGYETNYETNGEKVLSLWMREHARLAWVRLSDESFEWLRSDGDQDGDIVKRVESVIIDTLWLPLNLQGNRTEVCGGVKDIRRDKGG